MAPTGWRGGVSAGPPGWRLDRGDPRWPACLDDLAACDERDRVVRLFVDGDLPPLPGVALVGARRPTLQGLEVARRIGADLGRRGVTVVSGFAVGVDAEAHRGCLAGGGRTVAVLGCGLAVTYPRAHGTLRTELTRTGALLSEYPPTDGPLPWHFPLRNRIIAALSRAVIVVEAGEGSGALSTAHRAMELGREVLAVPGSIMGTACAGSNRLLRDGARPYLDPSDLSDLVPECRAELPGIALGGGCGGSRARRRPGGDGTRPRPEPRALGQRLLDLLGAEPVHREVLARGLDLGAPDVAVLIGELELTGAVRSLPGGRVVRARW